MANVPPRPVRYTAGRDLRLAGVSYAKGDEIPVEVVAKLRRASALLSRRWIIPDPDSNVGRTRSHRPQPTSIGVADRVAHLNKE